jgi:hypothetical protein
VFGHVTYRRYSDFLSLHNKIKTAFPVTAAFLSSDLFVGITLNIASRLTGFESRNAEKARVCQDLRYIRRGQDFISGETATGAAALLGTSDLVWRASLREHKN